MGESDIIVYKSVLYGSNFCNVTAEGKCCPPFFRKTCVVTGKQIVATIAKLEYVDCHLIILLGSDHPRYNAEY